jgi:hypothetical protein
MNDDKPEALPAIVGDIRAPDFTGYAAEASLDRQVRDALQTHVGNRHDIRRMQDKQIELELTIMKMTGFCERPRSNRDELDVRVFDGTRKWWIVGPIAKASGQDPARQEHSSIWIQSGPEPCTPLTLAQGRCTTLRRENVRPDETGTVLRVVRFGAYAILIDHTYESSVQFTLLETALEVKDHA